MTGIEYPKITLGGVEYEIKFTRATMYQLGKRGIRFVPQISAGGARMEFHEMVDVLYLTIGFKGTPDELAELCYDVRGELVGPLVDAWAKVVLPSFKPIQAAAANTTADQTPIQ